MTFAKRKIDLTFKLGKGAFGESGTDTVTVSGLRVQASLQNSGGASMGVAMVRVYGLTPSLMNDLRSVVRTSDNGGKIDTRFNQLLVEAGDDSAGMDLAFAGQISGSLIDLNGAPDSVLVITAHAGLLEAVKTTAPMSYPGSVDAAAIMKTLATENGYAFENNGVSIILSTPYFHGSPRDQMMSCARAANINWTIDNGTLAIWPIGGSRGGPVPLISPDTGMIGYPSGDLIGGVSVRTLFNPRLKIGKTCQVQSSQPYANGKFVMFDVSHELESETPNGQWETSFHGSPFLNA